MSDSLFQIVSRVKAAIEAYNSVWDFVKKEEWVKKFDEEQVSAH